MTPVTLLPPNATRFQRDLEQVNGITPGTLAAVEKIKTIKSDPPEQVLYWLIWEYGLGDILPYIADLKRLINEGLNWQRLRGTPKSLKLALGWINFDQMQIEEEVPGLYFYQYQLNLGKIPTRWEVDNIINLAKLSAPVRSRLSRLFNDAYDKRCLIPSYSQFGEFLSDYSGYRYKDIILSFGSNHGYYFTLPEIAAGGCLRQYREIKQRVRYEDYPLLSFMACMSEIPIPNRPSVITRQITIGVILPDDGTLPMAGLDWFGTWGRRTWEAPGFPGIGIRQLSRHCRSVQITEWGPDWRQKMFYSFHVPYTEFAVTRKQDSIRRSGVQIPVGSAAAQCYMTRGSGVQYPGITVELRFERKSGSQAVNTADESNPPRIARTRQYAAIQLSQINGMPLCSAGSDWFGPWDERTWSSPLFINIGVIHHQI